MERKRGSRGNQHNCSAADEAGGNAEICQLEES